MKRLARVCCTLAALVMSLGAVQSADAGLGLKAFSPNPARLNGVVTGGMPAWYQDQSGVAVDACFDIVNCGLVGFLPNNLLPLTYPTNFPDEAFYFLAQADFNLTGGATATVIMAQEYTFVNPVTGALTGPVATPTALSAPFQRLRVIVVIPGGGGVLPPAAAAGNFTVVTPWGDTVTFPAADARCANTGGDTKCTMTQDVPGPGAIPPNFAAALAAGVPGSIDTFIKATSPAPPTGFLGNGGAVLTSVTTAGTPAIVTLTDPLGNTGNNGPGGTYSTLVGKTIGMEIQPGANVDMGGINIITANAVGTVLVPQTVTITNTTGNPITFGAPAPALASAGADAADFIIAPPTQPAAPAPAIADCAAAPVPAGANCAFDITFKPAAVAKAARVATINLAPVNSPAVVGVDNPPPITMNLTGTGLVDVTTTVVGHGSVTPGTQAAGAGTAVTLTAAPSNKKFKVKDVVDGAAIVSAAPTDPTSFTIANVGAVNHAVTATFMPSGDLNQDGKLDIADAQKALKLAVGLQAADSDDPDNTAVDAAPLVAGVPAPDAKVGVGDVVVILRRVLNLDNW